MPGAEVLGGNGRRATARRRRQQRPAMLIGRVVATNNFHLAHLFPGGEAMLEASNVLQTSNKRVAQECRNRRECTRDSIN